jgi:hypothetical protein
MQQSSTMSIFVEAADSMEISITMSCMRGIATVEQCALQIANIGAGSVQISIERFQVLKRNLHPKFSELR